MVGPVQLSTAGIIASSERFAGAAAQVAQVGTRPSTLPNAAQVDLSSAALGMIGAKADFSINVAVLASTLKMERQVLDVLI